MINNEPKGDEIDLRMFLRSKGEIVGSKDKDIVRCIAQSNVNW